MDGRFAKIAFTSAARRLQERFGSRAHYARVEAHAAPRDALGEREVELLAQADSFYLATVSETGWPYVQHRGGPRGFLTPLSPMRLAFGDFRGNKQFVTAGNAELDARAAIIVMDYLHRRRLKLLGRLRFLELAEADAELVKRTAFADYDVRVERLALFDVAAFDWNCSQHITQRLTLEQLEAHVRPLRERIAELEATLGDRARQQQGV